jgi:hypothetical protein
MPKPILKLGRSMRLNSKRKAMASNSRRPRRTARRSGDLPMKIKIRSIPIMLTPSRLPRLPS